MPEFRKKAVKIQAFQLEYGYYMAPWPVWFQNGILEGTVVLDKEGCSITTLEGVMRANEGDWIIQGIKGELYPCKDEIFRETYEAV